MSVDKAELDKIQPYTWIEVEDGDRPNEPLLFISKKTLKTQQYLYCLEISEGDSTNKFATIAYNQVVSIIGPLVIPKLEQ